MPIWADSNPPTASTKEETLIIDRRYEITVYKQEEKLMLQFTRNIGLVYCEVHNTNTFETWVAEIDSSTGYYIMDFTNTPGVYIFTLHTDTGSYSCSFILT